MVWTYVFIMLGTGVASLYFIGLGRGLAVGNSTLENELSNCILSIF